MPWGLVVLGILSLMVFRRAHYAKRPAILWVLILWISLFIGSAVGGVLGMMLVEIGTNELAVPVSALCGMAAGVVIVMQAAGAPVRRFSEPSDERDRSS
jgi:F0F1-type ATP synthase assembly protein I